MKLKLKKLSEASWLKMKSSLGTCCQFWQFVNYIMSNHNSANLWIFRAFWRPHGGRIRLGWSESSRSDPPRLEKQRADHCTGSPDIAKNDNVATPNKSDQCHRKWCLQKLSKNYFFILTRQSAFRSHER